MTLDDKFFEERYEEMCSRFHSLKLFEKFYTDGMKTFFMRVPGGWIFETEFYNTKNHLFIPYSKEFSPLEKVIEEILK